ncbi:unnamed protein product [Lactuca virosa]|uniref:Uncharacterized protein n=1 Tax=Lactuca virosa TaxID=75947 RepID=A0AAU9LVW6_9ASTR|nr:unnamed protein product [Lactuca virosa]
MLYQRVSDALSVVPSSSRMIKPPPMNVYGTIGNKSSYGASHLGHMLLAYDGNKTVFSAGPLPFESQEFSVKLTQQNGWEKEFKINIKFTGGKDMNHLKQFLNGGHHDNPHETIQALDVFLRDCLQGFIVHDTGATISIVEYFLMKYDINLQFPHLPAIQAGTNAKPMYLPMTICSIVSGV